MGATCAPKCSTEYDQSEVKPEEPQDSTERFTQIINGYQRDNEKLRAELEEAKSQKDATLTENEVKQNEAVIRELEQMKKMLETRDRALVRGKVENALLTKANSLLTDDSSRVCKEGNLKHHVSKDSSESISVTDKWVEVHLTRGTIDNGDYKSGYVTLIQAESKDDEHTSKYEIFNVNIEKPNNLFGVSVVGSESELVFACESEDQRQEWVKCINEALTEVGEAPKNLEIEVVSLTLEFTKPKMGIRVEEVFVEEAEIDVKEQEANDGAEQVINDSRNKDAEQEIKQEAANDSDEEEPQHVERPCQLIVTKITDQDLVNGGLVEDSIVTAINDTSLEGMVYSEQIELLRTTPKPFKLTFEIEKYRETAADEGTGCSSILKELVSDGENSVKKAFYDLVKGTPFEEELQSTDDPVTTISALLGNQRRLMSLLKNIQVHEADL